MIQAIWSRTAQTRSCRCRSCFHAATTVARRATTAASRRRLKVSDLFTACYSTILATAAVADAKVKDERRKEWDRVIAEAKAELGQTTSQGEAVVCEGSGDGEAAIPKEELKTYSPWTDNGSGQTWGGVSAVEELSQDMRTLGERDITQEGMVAYSPWQDVGQQDVGPQTDAQKKFETKMKALDHKIRMLTRHELKDDVEDKDASESEWIDEEPDLVLYERDPLSPIHLERRELSCATLVEQLLTRLVGSIEQRRQMSPDQKAHPELQDVVNSIQQLRKQEDKLPNYKWEDLEVIARDRRALHRTLISICNAATPEDIPSLELMVAKICHNLLTFSSPISMVTYNVMVQSLDRLKQYELAQVFVDSFFYDTRLKPNHNSIGIILDHYHQKNDLRGWRALIQRMRASAVGHDMRIKRRWYAEIGRLSIQDWIRATKPSDLRLQKGRYFQDPAEFVSQKAPRDCNAFDTLIRSSLSFNGPRNAILHIKRALFDYQDIYSETICAVMEELLRQRDQRGSTSLIGSILTIWEERSDPEAITFDASVRRLIYQLLDMIGVDTTLGSQLAPPYQLSLDAVQTLLKQMHLVSIHEALGRSAAFIGTIEDHLEAYLDTHFGIGPESNITAQQSSENLPFQQESEEHWKSESPYMGVEEYMGIEETDYQPPAETFEVENVPQKEPLPLGWFAKVEEARADDLFWNKASGRWARLECLEKQLNLSTQRVQGLQDQALPFLLKAMPRYERLRYLDIISCRWIYRGKGERPRQYDEFLRVRQQGYTGLLNFVQGQVEFRKVELSKLEARVISQTPVNKLSLEDLEHYILRAAEHIAVNDQRGVALKLRFANLMQESQALQLKAEENDARSDPADINRMEAIDKQLWKLEMDFKSANVHQTTLLQMKEALNMEGRRRLLVWVQQEVKRSGNLVCKLEDDMSMLTRSSPMPCTLQRASWLVKESDLKVRDLAHELRNIQAQQRACAQPQKQPREEPSRTIRRAKWAQAKKTRGAVEHMGVFTATNSGAASLKVRKPSARYKKTITKGSREISDPSLHLVPHLVVPTVAVAAAAAG